MRWDAWTPRACMMLCFVVTICLMLLASVFFPMVTGEPVPPDQSDAVNNVTLVIIGGVLHWITEPAK